MLAPIMCHPFVGFTGAVSGPLIFGAILFGRWLPRRGAGPFNLDPQGVAGAFEPLLSKYIKAAEFIIGIATGSIVLLVGSSALRIEGGSISGHGGRLPWFFSSPLILLGWSVMFGVAFIVWEIFCYEEYQHGNPHTGLVYSTAEALGFGSLLCFCFGYMLLIFLVTRA
jgi:hypothetical protein